MLAEEIDEVGSLGNVTLASRDDERIRCGGFSSLDHPLSFCNVVLEKRLLVIRHILECDQRAGLLIVDVATDAPFHSVDGRIRAIPCARCCICLETHGVTVGAARRVRLVEAADRVVKVRD